MSNTSTRVEFVNPAVGQEEFVRHIFSKHAKDLGFEIINIQKRFPDCTAIDQRNNKNIIVDIELEYEAQNFIKHGHDKQLETGKKYIIVCWSAKGIDSIPKDIEVVALSDKSYNFTISENIPNCNYSDIQPLYRIIPYNSDYADGKMFDYFENTCIFRTDIKFANNHLPKGSVIIIYERGKLIGELTVMNYIWIEDAPKTDYEKKLYGLLSYPVTISEDTISDLDNDYWTKGHIVYSGFKMYYPKVPFSILERKMSRGGSLNITIEDLRKIRGQ